MTDQTDPSIPDSPIDVSVAEPADRDRVLRTIVDAFESDPFLRLALPDDDEYAEHAPRFFGVLFDRRVERTTVWLANGGDAVALWDGPGVGHTDDPTEGLPKQAKSIIAAYEESVHAVMPTVPHWYLGVLATVPAARGRGLARAVLRQGLSLAARAAVPAVLETTNPGNLEIYRRLGWRVHAEANEPLPIWILQYDVPGS
jgi:ribosomal protein S18 acetylase RimI-like enzyme